MCDGQQTAPKVEEVAMVKGALNNTDDNKNWIKYHIIIHLSI